MYYNMLYYSMTQYTIYYTVVTILHYTTLHYTTLHYTTLHYTTLHYTTLHYYTILYYTMRYYTILHYNLTILHYTILHYTILHYTILVVCTGRGGFEPCLRSRTLLSLSLSLSSVLSEGLRLRRLVTGGLAMACNRWWVGAQQIIPTPQLQDLPTWKKTLQRNGKLGIAWRQESGGADKFWLLGKGL